MIILATFLVPSAGALVRALWEVGTVTLTCRRVEPLQVQCQESRTHLFGLQTSTSLTMDWVSQSRVDSETRTIDGDTITTYWLTLVTRNGDVRSSLFQPQDAFAQLQTFLHSTESRLTLQQTNHLSSLGLIFAWSVATGILSLGLIMLTLSIPRLTFDKKKGLLVRGVYGMRRIAFLEIRMVEVHPVISFKNLHPETLTRFPVSGVDGLKWRVGLRLASGEFVEVSGDRDIGGKPQHKSLAEGRAIAQAISAFLGIPLREGQPDALEQITLDGQTTFESTQHRVVVDGSIWRSVKDRVEIPQRDIQAIHLLQYDDDGTNVYYYVLQTRAGQARRLEDQVNQLKTAERNLNKLSKVLAVPISTLQVTSNLPAQ